MNEPLNCVYILSCNSFRIKIKILEKHNIKEYKVYSNIGLWFEWMKEENSSNIINDGWID